MKRFAVPFLLPAFALAGLALVPPARGEEPAAKGLAALGWMQGAWEGKTDEGSWEAAYTSPASGSMLSSTKLSGDGRERHFDFERWREEGGVVVMTPFPRGKASLDFRAVEHDAAKRRIVLENAKNDFPRRFTYASPAKDRLVITLEGEQGGHPATMTLELTRRR